MQKLVIEGGKPLEGEIFLHGAKNSALPILAGTLLCDGETVLENCPRLTDVFAACRILTHLGCRCTVQEHTVTVQVRDLCADTIPEVLMQEMRSSIIFLGAVLGRSGSCHLSYPGGCELGPRPIDMHLDALRQMGAHFSVHGGQLDCTAPEGLHGAGIHLPFPSVGATENVMLSAVLAEGRTVLHNAAREPEICDLAAFLRGCGADISGDGESTIVISGVRKLRGSRHTIMPDRIACVVSAPSPWRICSLCWNRPAVGYFRSRIGCTCWHRGGCGRCRFSVPCPTPVFPPMHRRSSWQC